MRFLQITFSTPVTRVQGPGAAQPAVRAGQGGDPGRDPPGPPGDRHPVRGAAGPDTVRGPQGGQAQARHARRVSHLYPSLVIHTIYDA